MEVRSSFALPVAPEAAWALLLDVPRVVPLMPGAELLDTVDDAHWKARLSTRLGPMTLGFDADIERTEVDEAARAVTLTASARERSGRGAARARIVNRLRAEGGTTVIEVTTDLSLTGAVARFGRQSVVQDMTEQMTDQFAANLRQELTGGPAPTAAPGPKPAPSAARMLAGIVLRTLIRGLQRLLERVEG